MTKPAEDDKHREDPHGDHASVDSRAVQQRLFQLARQVVLEQLIPAMEADLGALMEQTARLQQALDVAAVLGELKRLASEHVAIFRRALEAERAPCAWCGSERPLTELAVDCDDGGVVCRSVEACCDRVNVGEG